MIGGVRAIEGVRPEVMYSKEQWSQATGLGEDALRVARRNGLPLLYCHRKAFVYGKDWIEYVRSAGKAAKDE